MGTDERKIAALVGNPNVGKSTLFNRLTGMNQHTGNWPGKTVSLAQGMARSNQNVTFVDLPGTYSLQSRSREERVTEDFLRSGEADCVIAVCDASCLERNLILVQQLMRLEVPMLLCVNLADEAQRNGLTVNMEKLELLLGVPAVLTSGTTGSGVSTLLERVGFLLEGKEQYHPVLPSVSADPEQLAHRARAIASQVVSQRNSPRQERLLAIDRILTSRRWGFPVAGLLLMLVVWITVVGANWPSNVLKMMFDKLGLIFLHWAVVLHVPAWISGLLIDGVYATAARVISVMLPPMAIFFPLFTLLEDVGYLPRVAFLLDHGLSKCGACGKQGLTMCMGLGCNAVGVMGCRIIDSPRERILAMVTNAMIPCNGRFPTLIVLASILFGAGHWAGPLAVTGMILLGMLGAMGATAMLSKTALRGTPSAFLLELPPLRRPRLGTILVRSVLDRTACTAARAVTVAAPAGAVLWCLGNVRFSGMTLLRILADWLDPIGSFFGLSGALLLAFLLSIPANELLFPVLMMIVTGGSTLDAGSGLLTAVSWTNTTVLCTMVFTVFHWPCSTTILTIQKESGKLRYTVLACLLPTFMGLILCRILRCIC